MILSKKLIVTVLAVSCILGSAALTVHAAGHTQGCEAQSLIVQCGATVPTGEPESSHILYYTVNGPVVCETKGVYSYHYIYCPGCSATISSNEVRRCKEIHSSCPDKFGLCQY